MMRGAIRGALCALLVLTCFAWAQPFHESYSDQVTIHVLDIDVDDGAFELVTEDTGFTQMSTDSLLNVFHDTTGGGGAVDTALVWVTGIRQNSGTNALQFYSNKIKVGGGDTVRTTGDTLHIYQSAHLDSILAGVVLVFSSGATPRGSLLDTIDAGKVWQPNAHVFFGNDDRGVIDYADVRFVNPATCELRAWTNINGDVDYSTGYAVLARQDSVSSGGYWQSDWPRGIYLGENAYAAWMCQGDAANADVSVTLQYRRRD